MAKQGDKGIVWCDETWNPTRGCSRVSEGCRNCYAETVARRFSGPGLPYEGLVNEHGRWNGKIHEVLGEKLAAPIRWKRPRRIFVDSMSDLFHENVDGLVIERVFGIMAVASQHTFQVLTKRPERAVRFFQGWHVDDGVAAMGAHYARIAGRKHFVWDGRGGDPGAYGHWGNDEKAKQLRERRPWPGWPLPNVHIGVSVEDQETADERIPLLLQIPAAIRFLSVEPMLGPVDLTRIANWVHPPEYRTTVDVLRFGTWDGAVNGVGFINHSDMYDLFGRPLQWVIGGGESGPDARPVHPEWARSLRDQCVSAGTKFLWKQWGEWAPFSQVPEDLVESTYRSRMKAGEGEDQGALDELYGRDCTVEQLCLRADGNHLSMSDPNAFRSDVPGWPAMQAFRLGKKRSGRMLDGRTWDEFPTALP